MMGWAGYGGLWMGAVMMLFWAALIGLGFYFIVKTVKHGAGQGPDTRQSGLIILRERYARGEIDDEEYLKRKKMLQED